MTLPITFERATFEHKETLFQWLDEPHVMEFWDNAPEHRLDIINFMEGRTTRSPYFNGDHNYAYWIGFIGKDPFALMMTSELLKEQCLAEKSPYIPLFDHLFQGGKTIALDFMIGNTHYLGKGLAAPTLCAFMDFFKDSIDPSATMYMIDPSHDNPRAQHVYQKAGFRKIGTYTSQRGYFEGDTSDVMIKKYP